MAKLRKPVALLGLLLGLALLILQLVLTVPARVDAGDTPLVAIIYYFSFFTILTNLLVVLVYLAAVVKGRHWLALFRKPVTRATAAGAIVLVGLFYHFMLAALWQPQGLFAVADFGLHYVAPQLYLVWFALWNRSGTLRYSAIPRMLIYPVLYLVYILARGALTGSYPYLVIDAAQLGYGQVALNALGLLVAFVILYAAAIAIDRALLIGAQRQ